MHSYGTLGIFAIQGPLLYAHSFVVSRWVTRGVTRGMTRGVTRGMTRGVPNIIIIIIIMLSFSTSIPRPAGVEF